LRAANEVLKKFVCSFCRKRFESDVGWRSIHCWYVG
jgi:hypothetical protein